MSPRDAGPRLAFLLSQLGAVSAERWSERLRELGLRPTDAAILRLVARSPGLSQRTLADRVGLVPSRLVVLIDSLEARHLLARRRSTDDRRNYELSLTEAGSVLLGQLREVSEAHEADMVGDLSEAEREQLGVLLRRLARISGLDADVHPGIATSS